MGLRLRTSRSLVAILLLSLSLLLVSKTGTTRSLLSNLPAPTHSMFFGYYYDISTYGDFRNEIKDSVTTYLNWAYLMTDNSQLITSFGYAGKPFIFGPRTNPTDIIVTVEALASLDAISLYWANVSYVYFDEMSNLNKTGLETFITSWKSEVAARGLAAKPIIVNFPPIMGPGSWQANNIDVVGIDCYLDPSQQNSGTVTAQLNAVIDTALTYTGPRDVVFTIQGYNRNAAWTNVTSLKEMQSPPYLKGYNNPHVLGLLVFAYGRDDGASLSTRGLPQCIRTEHLRIFNAISGGTQPDSISCTNVTPTLNYFAATLSCGILCKSLSCNIPSSLSGIYELIPDKRNDTLYSVIYAPDNYITMDVAIPNPFAETTLLPSSDS